MTSDNNKKKISNAAAQISERDAFIEGMERRDGSDDAAYVRDMEMRAEMEKHLMDQDTPITIKKTTEYTYTVQAATSDITWAFSNRLDEANALQLQTPIIFDDARRFWMWDTATSCYIAIDKTTLLNILLSESKDCDIFKSSIKTEVVNALESTGRNRWTQTKEVPVSWIQFKDCVYDIETDERHEATPEYFYINPIPHDLGESTDTPVIDRLFKEWVGEDYAQRLLEIVSYSIYNDYPIHRIFAFFGSGRNGKGQFMNLLKTMLGVHNTCATSLERLSDSRFEAAKLHGRKVAFISETNTTVLKKTDQLKSLSGGDLIGTEYKGGAHFDFMNTAKIVMATNSLPDTTDKTRGFFSRWVITDFPNEFSGGRAVIDDISDVEYSNMCLKCIACLKQLLVNGEFHREGDIDARMTKYVETSDHLSTFIRDMCVVEWDAKEPTFNFIKEYRTWSEAKRFRIGKDADVRKEINDRYESDKDDWYVNGERKKWQTLYGLRLRGSEFTEKTEDGTNAPDGTYVSLHSPMKKESESSVPLRASVPSLKSAIYKVGYVRGIDVFTAAHVLMEMEKGLNITAEDIETALEVYAVELKIERADGDGVSWRTV